MALGLLSILILATAPAAFADFIAPDAGSGSPNAEGIRSLYLIIYVLAVIIFVGVGGLLLFTLRRFSAKRHPVAEQIHGNNKLEIGWTLGAALLLVVISIVTFAKLDGIDNPPNSGAEGAPVTEQGSFIADGARRPMPPNGKSLNIQVNGQQYMWRYVYADGDKDLLNNVFAYETMVVPVNTTVTLTIRSNDVQHSWWVPDLGGKFDAVPGYTNYTWFKATKTGTFRGQCAELCGRNHANMVAQVKVVEPAAFEAWYARQKQNIEGANKLAAAGRQALAAQAAQTSAK